MSRRPEHQAPPEIFYGVDEARKYSTNSRMMEIQCSMAERALELLTLPEDVPCHLLDLGCGSGLSGSVLEESGHVWVGVDISQAMLDVAIERDVEGDVLLGDLGQGLPFRAGAFDGAISISALQWLCNADKLSHKPPKRLLAFFSSLYACLSRGARAVLQFYPENPQQTELVMAQATRAGFSGGLVVDFPNSTKARKVFLVLMTGGAQPMPTALGGEEVEEETVAFSSSSSDEGRPGLKRRASWASSSTLSDAPLPPKRILPSPGRHHVWLQSFRSVCSPRLSSPSVTPLQPHVPCHLLAPATPLRLFLPDIYTFWYHVFDVHRILDSWDKLEAPLESVGITDPLGIQGWKRRFECAALLKLAQQLSKTKPGNSSCLQQVLSRAWVMHLSSVCTIAGQYGDFTNDTGPYEVIPELDDLLASIVRLATLLWQPPGAAERDHVSDEAACRFAQLWWLPMKKFHAHTDIFLRYQLQKMLNKSVKFIKIPPSFQLFSNEPRVPGWYSSYLRLLPSDERQSFHSATLWLFQPRPSDPESWVSHSEHLSMLGLNWPDATVEDLMWDFNLRAGDVMNVLTCWREDLVALEQGFHLVNSKSMPSHGSSVQYGRVGRSSMCVTLCTSMPVREEELPLALCFPPRCLPLASVELSRHMAATIEMVEEEKKEWVLQDVIEE